jgi:uncharacterized protein (DUF433 family)
MANPDSRSLYGGADPAELPRYTYLDAFRATQVPPSTIAAWVRGMRYTKKGGRSGRVEPVIERPVRGDSRLSFNNLLEVHVLRALRKVHEVQLKAVRAAIRHAREEHGIPRLLIDPQLRTTGGALFLDYYFQLVPLSQSGQFAMRAILQQFLRRVRVDEHLRQAMFYPLPRNPKFSPTDEPVLVSPLVSFGDPVIGRIGVSTRAIASRLNAGEEKAAIIDDYRLSEDEFEEAILYEEAAAA